MMISGDTMKLKYGIISTATITDRFINAVQQYGDEVYAIASRSLEKAQEKAKQFTIEKGYGSYTELYQDENVDIVYIATNNGTHAKEIKNALFYHKHVICEKPLALSKQEAQDLFAYANKQKRFLMEAQKSVFLPVTQDLKKIIQTKALGKLQQVNMCSSFPYPTSSWMLDPTQGGVIYGSASYTLEYLDFLLEPTNTTVEAMGFQEKDTACDRVSINIKMNHVLINSCISMSVSTNNHALFYFEHGYVEIENYWKATSYTIHTKDVKTVEHPISYEMIYEVEHIHNCIEKKLLLSFIMSDKRTIACCKYVDTMISSIKKMS